MADTNPWVLDLSTNPPNIYNSTISEHKQNAFQPPYPANFWFVNQTEDDVNHLGELQYHSPCFEPPYPVCFWSVDNQGTDVIHDGELDYEKMGAFCHCTELKRIIIPPTVKHIGEYAFRNTNLRSVTIASDCTYSETSFPDGCVVNFYPD